MLENSLMIEIEPLAQEPKAEYIVKQVNSYHLDRQVFTQKGPQFPVFGSRVSRGSSAIGISWMVTGLVTVNGNIRSELVNPKDLTFSPVDEFPRSLSS